MSSLKDTVTYKVLNNELYVNNILSNVKYLK